MPDREDLTKGEETTDVEIKRVENQHHDPAAKKTEELKKNVSEYDALWDKYLRVCADFDNVRKRWDKERQSLVKFANFSLIKNLLVIVDEFEHALRAIEEHSQCDKIVEGVELTYNNLRSVLDKEGLKAIEAKGKKFDPHIHEIVGQVENSDIDEHTVVEEIQKGYFLGDDLLRTSKVIISVPKVQGVEDGDQKDNDKDNEEAKSSDKEEDK